LTECDLAANRPASGDEVTYSEWELDSLEAVKRFAAGEPVRLRTNDRYRTLRRVKSDNNTKSARRKGA
jgi:hypothetical protein